MVGNLNLRSPINHMNCTEDNIIDSTEIQKKAGKEETGRKKHCSSKHKKQTVTVVSPIIILRT